MPWHAVNTGSQFNLPGSFGFNHEMFFAVRNGLRVWQIQENRPRMRIFRSDRFVAEIKAKAVPARLADHASQNQ